MANNSNSHLLLVALKRSFPILCLLFIFAIVWYGHRALNNPATLPIRHVIISTDAKYISAKKIKDIVAHNARGGFFSFDSAHLQRALSDLPWMASVTIQREWPDTIKVIIYERKPLARWKQRGVLDQAGNVFFPSLKTIPATLPVLSGPAERLSDVIALYKQLLPLTELMSKKVAKLTLNDRGSCTLQWVNGVQVMLGRQDIISRYERFMQLYPKIIEKSSSKISTVDLRYPNGVAIKWTGHRTKLVN